MQKNTHEIRDPIHVFVRLDNHERKVLNSRQFQRLRHIHQLALTYLVYPGATHKRFEHSLGVMELASRVFDVVTNGDNVKDEIRSLLKPLGNVDELRYWRRVLRMAALCHDMGHLPFSHAAEDLLPQGWDHERLTKEIIASDEMKKIWESITPPLRHEDIIKLAVGPKKAKDLQFSDWEAILSEIIVGDAFGADRMDYLLRDSHHLGVAYGKFDHYRLIDTLRILPLVADGGEAGEPTLGVEEGGIQSAEALMVARYFMYSQVYFHPVRRIYDIHLKDFLKEWIDRSVFSTDIGKFLSITDNEVTAALLRAAFDECENGYLHARRIVCREHFKRLYERNPNDVEINPEAGQAIFEALCQEFGTDLFRRDRYSQKGGAPDFPVRMRDDRIVSSLAISEVLNKVPLFSVDYVFADRDTFDTAKAYLERNREELIKLQKEEANDG
ncbi:MAG: HD domain-containing protein [Syntrophobacteraceae bacterium]|nr:HD domain-containing protein [Syntrophobacteraceae bacterium]